ncbi:MAG: hypothetical protein EBR09_01220 [Proteobacteria bacterium]|nr:hypothetical protein [Pseudomonadota bacterium]
MIFRFIVICLAAVLVVSATGRILPEVFRSRREDVAPPNVAEGAGEPLIRLGKTQIRVSRVLFQKSGFMPAASDVLVLNQSAGSRAVCVYGVFRVSRVNDGGVLLRAVSKSAPSRMQVWAETQGLNTEWSFVRLKADEQPRQTFQQCSQWMDDFKQNRPAVHSVQGKRFFMAGRRFAEVKLVHPDSAFLQVDHLRKGWWVKPISGRHSVVLRVKNASTGLSEQWTLNFAPAKEKKAQSNSTKSAKNRLHKPFALPGWD